MTRFSIVCLICFLSLNSFCSQTDYYDYINKAEEEFVLSKSRDCFTFYELAFNTEARYFAKDSYIASEIALFLNDKELFLKYMKLSFDLGLPWSAIKSGKIIEDRWSPELESELKSIYQNRNIREIDRDALDKIYMYCYLSDSIKLVMGQSVEKVNQFYAVENEFRDYLYDTFLTKGIFPNENLIGIATDSIYQDFLKRYNKVDVYANQDLGNFGKSTSPKIENDLVSKYSFSVLLHSNCSFTKFRKELWDAVINGYMLPSEYALLHETSILWNANSGNPWDDCELIHQKAYYNLLGFNPMKKIQTHVDESNKELIEQVELNRKSIHMQTLMIDEKKKVIQKETGIRFFFGFLS